MLPRVPLAAAVLRAVVEPDLWEVSALVPVLVLVLVLVQVPDAV